MSAAPWFCWVDLLIHRGIEVTFADGTCPSRCPHHQVSHCEALQGWSADAQLFASLGKWCMTMEIHGNTRFFSKNDVLDLAFCGIFSVWYGSLSTKVGHEMHIQEEMLLELWPRGPCAGTQVDYDDFLVALPERDHLNSFTKEVPLFLRYLKAWEWMKGNKRWIHGMFSTSWAGALICHCSRSRSFFRFIFRTCSFLRAGTPETRTALDVFVAHDKTSVIV